MEKVPSAYNHPVYRIEYDDEQQYRNHLEPEGTTAAPSPAAEVVSSEHPSRPVCRANHTLMLDLDVPATLVPSTTPGHSHLYIDVRGDELEEAGCPSGGAGRGRRDRGGLPEGVPGARVYRATVALGEEEHHRRGGSRVSKKLYRPDQPRLIINQQNAKTAAATGEALFKAAGTQFLANLLLAGYRLSNPAGEDITEELLKELAPPEPEGEADHVAKRLHVVGAKPEPGKEAA